MMVLPVRPFNSGSSVALKSWISHTRRFQSTVGISDLNKIPIRLIAIPITTKKSFIYCKHNELSLPPRESQSLIDKATEKAIQTWNKLEQSDKKINVRIVAGFKKLLSKIPWDEGSLKSIPSRDAIVRELAQNETVVDPGLVVDGNGSRKLIKQKDVIAQKLDISDKLTQIPVYYPSSITSRDSIIEQLTNYSTVGLARHRKNMLYCLLGLPFTVPFIILPVIPNLPGFYLCYRAYCHFVAQNGAKHLQYLLTDSHLKYEKLDHNTLQLYKSTKDAEVLGNIESYLQDGGVAEEKILLGEDIIAEICQSYHCEDLAEDLKIALQQERAKLGH